MRNFWSKLGLDIPIEHCLGLMALVTIVCLLKFAHATRKSFKE